MVWVRTDFRGRIKCDAYIRNIVRLIASFLNNEKGRNYI